MPVAALPTLNGLQFYYHEVIGFELIDQTHGTLGHIDSIMDLPGNPCSNRSGKEKRAFPMTDSVLFDRDRAQQRILLDLPEGMYDLYFGPSAGSEEEG